MGVRFSRATRGQMTIELAVALPVLIAVAVVAVNALAFIADCAVFDRVAHDAVRVFAAAPAYGQGPVQACASCEVEIERAIGHPNVEVRVSHEPAALDLDRYTATLVFHPTLFGLGLRSEVFGVQMPALSHSTTYVVDGYKPGVIV